MIKPLPGHVLIESIEENESRTRGGLYLPDDLKDKPSKGRVVAVGADLDDFSDSFAAPFLHCPVKTGQVVAYKKWSNQEIVHEGKEYLLVSFNELLAVIE